jgi:hypothetical protein
VHASGQRHPQGRSSRGESGNRRRRGDHGHASGPRRDWWLIFLKIVINYDLLFPLFSTLSLGVCCSRLVRADDHIYSVNRIGEGKKISYLIYLSRSQAQAP